MQQLQLEIVEIAYWSVPLYSQFGYQAAGMFGDNGWEGHWQEGWSLRAADLDKPVPTADISKLSSGSSELIVYLFNTEGCFCWIQEGCCFSREETQGCHQWVRKNR